MRKARPDIQKLFDRLPPHSLEAEMSLLGSMILDHSVIGEVIVIVPSSEAFYNEAHAAIYEALTSLYDRRQSGDLVQLTEALKDRDVYDDVGGTDYLLNLAQSVPSAASAPYYAEIVREKWQLRRLIDASSDIVYSAYHAGEIGDGGARTVLDKAEQSIFEIAEKAETGQQKSLNSVMLDVMNSLDRQSGRSVTGISTGFYDLDEMTSGLQPGEMIIVAARPSMGKTAFALNIAQNVALGGRRHEGGSDATAPVGFFSMEMSQASVVQRMLSSASGVNSHLMRTNRLAKEHFTKLMEAYQKLEKAPLYIDDTPGLTVMTLRAKARRMVKQYGVSCIVVDYLQLMSAPAAARDGRQQEVSTISRQIKALARELNLPIVCLAQLNRGAEQREGHRPRMSDLRESGSIEQDADVIALLHREEYYHQQDPEWARMNPEKVGLAELIIAKQRNGPTGTVKLTWLSGVTKFDNHEPHRSGYETTARSEPAQETGGYLAWEEANSDGLPM